MRVLIAAIFLVSATLGPDAARGQSADSPTQYEGALPLVMTVGELRIIGKTVDIVTPVKNPICDDLRVVNVVDTPDGPAFQAIAPGKTLCSVSAGPLGPRRVIEITVGNR